MPSFDYIAVDAAGKKVKGVLEAESQASAIAKVREMQYFPTRVTAKKLKTKTKTAAVAKKSGGASNIQIKIPFLSGRVPVKQVTPFIRQLSTLIDAGLPLIRSLDVLRNQMKAGGLKDILGEVSEEVEAGSTFSEALAKHPKAFSKLFISMVKAGEIGGVLDVVLQRLADFAEKNAALIRKIKGAMVYPIIVIFVIIGVLALIFKVVIPTFVKMFAEMDQELPPATRVLIAIYDFLQTKEALMIPVIVVIFIVLMKVIRSTKTGGYVLDTIQLKLPIVGALIQKLVVARFSRVLGTLIASGVPILQALAITKDTAGNVVVERAISNVHDSIREGETIAKPLEESKVFPPLVISMITVGEETGNLDAMLMKIADAYDEEVDAAVAALSSILEPLLIVLMGGIVFFVVFALFMPLIDMAMNIA